MRVKQTARKSTASRDPSDALNARQMVLETKRSSMGSTSSKYMKRESSAGDSSGPGRSREPPRGSSQIPPTRAATGSGKSGRPRDPMPAPSVAGPSSSTVGSNATSRHSMPSGLGSRGKQIRINDEARARPKTKRGEKALSEIKNLRKSTQLLIPKAVFHRVVREITANLGESSENLRYQVAALLALQEAAEHYMTTLFEDAYLCALHAKRVTLFTKDMDLCRRLRYI